MERTKYDKILTVHGRYLKLMDVDDVHLVNLIHHQKVYSNIPLTNFLLEMGRERGLSKEFLNMGPLPYKNPDGNWEIFDYNNEKMMSLSKENNEWD